MDDWDNTSGITFISVPGGLSSQFSYMQMVLIFWIQVIARILLPLYYKLGLTVSILTDKFGKFSYKSDQYVF